ncbi:glycosyltransferase family 4 protein [Wukongibacter sp. M2B1]|uniref:glycosyltransferase family 4 protein n=1 Tax=Wukongibacter sp. M2B1 TaxID=3088895 RepID=UPI003D7A51FF
MRIAIFTDTFLPEINGVTKTLKKMKEYMDEEDIEYRFFIPGEENNMVDNTISFSSFRFFLYSECKVAIPRYKSIKESLDKFKPDIIHVVTPFSIGIMGLKYSKENNIPLVASYHTDFPKYLKFYNLEFLENTLWYFFRWFHSHSYINFCPSINTKEDMEKHGIKNVELWGRGIDTASFNPNKKSKELRRKYCSNGEALLLYVGRVAPEKELDVLLDAAKKLNNRNIKYKLVVIGDGPSRQDFEMIGIDNVIFAGYKSGEELQSYYASADIFTFPSSSETYGNVILEAMASGLAVVCPYAGGLKENLIDQYNGLAFEAGNSDSMAERIIDIIEDDKLRLTLKKNARSYTLSKSWEKIYTGLFSRYSMLIEDAKDMIRRISA